MKTYIRYKYREVCVSVGAFENAHFYSCLRRRQHDSELRIRHARGQSGMLKLSV
jgi:hypothetical protein